MAEQNRTRPGRLAALALLILALLCLVGCSAGSVTVPTVTSPGAIDRTGGPVPQPGDAMLAPTDESPTTAPTIGVTSRPTNPAPTTTRTPKPTATATRKASPSPQATRNLPAGVALPTPLPRDRLATVRYGQLPGQARVVIGLIAAGGPFPYRQDGAVFQNREGLLPRKSSGYYHEYTVETPGSPDRGARRIITGGQGEFYYTDDHYASFRRVVP